MSGDWVGESYLLPVQTYDRSAGTDQAAAVQGDFRNMLDALAVHFANHNFLLGERPCLADFALAGASKAHFLCDPEPKSWLREHSDILHQYT